MAKFMAKKVIMILSKAFYVNVITFFSSDSIMQKSFRVFITTHLIKSTIIMLNYLLSTTSEQHILVFSTYRLLSKTLGYISKSGALHGTL